MEVACAAVRPRLGRPVLASTYVHIHGACSSIMDPAKEGNWPVYLQSVLQSLTAAAQPRPRALPTVHAAAAGQPIHCPTISVQQVCEIHAEHTVCMCVVNRTWHLWLVGVR